MLKSTMMFFLAMVYAKVFSQTCLKGVWFFANDLLYFPRQPTGLGTWHYKAIKYYKPDNDPNKWTEDYKYIHNGDDLKGAQDMFAGNVQGSAWLKNFDFGKFASVVIAIGADRHGRASGAFEWNGQLLFFKVIKNHRIGGTP